MDVILHIGAHRCGTTTFQQLLHRNRERLSARALSFWLPADTRNGFFAGLIHRPDDVTPLIEKRGNRSLGLISIELERLARAGSGTLLISEENMLGSVRQNLRTAGLYPDLHARLTRIAKGLRPHVRRIGLAIRAYDTFWASSLAFGVSLGNPMPGPRDLDALTDQPRRWRHVVGEVASVFPDADLVVWPFERFVSRPEVPLFDMVRTLGGSGDLVGLRDWQNASPRRDKLRRLLAMRGEQQERRALPEGDGRWMPFDVHQQAELRRDYAADLDWLRRGASGLARLLEGPGDAPSWTDEALALPATPTDAVRGRAGTGWPSAPGFEITSRTRRTDRHAGAGAGGYERRDNVV